MKDLEHDELAWSVVGPWVNQLAEQNPMRLPTLEAVRAALASVSAARSVLLAGSPTL